MDIKVVDQVFAKAEGGFAVLKNCLAVQEDFYVQGRFKKNRVPRWKRFITKAGVFPLGLKERVDAHLKHIKIEPRWTGLETIKKIKPDREPKLPGKNPRPDQLRLIASAIDVQRGVLVSPTGTGKTLLALWIASCYPRAFFLFLVHTKDLMKQTHEEFTNHGFNDVGMLGGGYRDTDARILVATRQSLIRAQFKPDRFDAIIIDEAHHVAKLNGQYVKILRHYQAPMRLGLTATLPRKEEALMTLEGFIGPVIGELTMGEARQKEILADVKVIIKKVAKVPGLRTLRPYSAVYQQGIVENRARNRMILMDAKEDIRAGETVLMFVTKIEHGNILQAMAQDMFNLNPVFIRGETDQQARNEARHKLRSKEIKFVISTVVWKEGVNVPSLGVISNAAGGESELVALQSAGRGLRRTSEKTVVKLRDYFDTSNHFLIRHSGSRVCLYIDEGWI